ncbi:hypothetical protein BCR42DRAFT_173354 [Absidia repens]|uniref:Uncharacterized protein n=1 Tax=Absidia repens TaxID=90262 RepID=A0A1X2I027_9FUNG|nr:hypothetical protein BCR42DRAFT_173354 [Absidia repens]
MTVRSDTKQIKYHGDALSQHQPITSPSRHLPDEILSRIIYQVTSNQQDDSHQSKDRQVEEQQDLYHCTLINKQFYAIANPLLWEAPVLYMDPKRLHQLLDCLARSTEQQQQQQKPLGHFIRTLVLYNTFCTDTQLLQLMPLIPHVTMLSIQNDRYAMGELDALPMITNTSLQHLPFYCSQLTSLDLSFIHLSTATVHALGHHCHQLGDLVLFFDTKPPEGLFSTLGHCPLETLRITGNGQTHCGLTVTMAMDMIARFQHLTSLELTHIDPFNLIMKLAQNNNNNINDGENKTTRTCAVPWPHLKTLDIEPCYELDDATFIAFINTHPHLQQIHVMAPHLTDASLDAMAAHLGDLRDVYFSGMDEISMDGVCRLVRHCPRLVSMRFRSCEQMVACACLLVVDGGANEGFSLDLGEKEFVKIRSAQGEAGHGMTMN